jgi:alpha-L-fucosidase
MGFHLAANAVADSGGLLEMRSSLWALAVVMALGPTAVGQNLAPDQAQKQLDAGNEPMKVGDAAARDAAAVQDAKTGWYSEALKTRDQRLTWWREARFGCFVHWGAYSVLGGVWKDRPNPGYAEHIMRVNKIPLDVYRDEVAAKFHPDAYDAKTWVRQMKAAGMQYVILTSKHHDGFAIWPSEVNKYNIRDVSHFQRDPLKELVEAAHAEGMHVGFYYSHAFDWEDPNAPGNDWDYQNPGGDLGLFGGLNWYNAHPEMVPRIEKYVYGKAIPELKELIAKYHPDIFWFDTPSKLPFFEQAAIVKAVREADPNVVINGRAARTTGVNLGDYLDTSDRPEELRPTPGDWEAIPTTNESYGYNKLDTVHKPVAYFIQLLAKTSAKGGDILLNIGPKGDGTIDPPDAEILAGIGKWMAVNGDSIHGTERTPLDRQAWGDSTLKGSTLYLHVMNWPSNGKLLVGGLLSDVKQAYLLSDASKKPLKTERVGTEDLLVQVPRSAPDVVDTVLVLKSDGPVKGRMGHLLRAQVVPNRLLGFDAAATGKGFAYGDGKTAQYYVDGLEKPGNVLTWNVRADRVQRFAVEVKYSTPKATRAAGSRFVVKMGEKVLTAPIEATSSARQLTTVRLGELEIQPGVLQDLTVTVEGGGDPVHFFEVDLKQP